MFFGFIAVVVVLMVAVMIRAFNRTRVYGQNYSGAGGDSSWVFSDVGSSGSSDSGSSGSGWGGDSCDSGGGNAGGGGGDCGGGGDGGGGGGD